MDEFDASLTVDALDTQLSQRALRLECLRMVADRDVPMDELVSHAEALVDWVMGSAMQ